jgi:hypothetical protein
MYRFPVKVEEKGDWVVVNVLAVPGCVAGGRSRTEALENARAALQAIFGRAGPGFMALAGQPSQALGTGGGTDYVEAGAVLPESC